MLLTILTFGIARDIIGSSSTSVELPAHATVAYLITHLKEQHPALQKLSSFAIAVNGAYATAETILLPTDEIAIIPPVSGG